MRPTSPVAWTVAPARSAFADTEVCDAWNRLNALRGNHPILDALAIRSAIEVFGQGDEWLMRGVDVQGDVAMLVVRRQASLQWQTFQPSQLPLGALVCRRDIGLADLALSVMRSTPRTCWILSLTQVDPMLHDRPAASGWLWMSDYIDTAWLDIAGSFDDYWNARGKNLRQNLRKQRKKLHDEGVRVSMHVLRSPDEIARAITQYGELESKGWKASEGTAIHPDNDQGRFYRGWLEGAAAVGETLIFEYRFDDRTVAMNLGLLRNGTLIVLKTAYDESLSGSLSPAFLLREDELRSFFAGDEVRRIEYFGRMMEWHKRLTETHRSLYHVTAYRWNWLRRVAEMRRRRRAASPGDAAPRPTDHRGDA